MLDEKKLAAMVTATRGHHDAKQALLTAGFKSAEVNEHLAEIIQIVRAEWARARFGSGE